MKEQGIQDFEGLLSEANGKRSRDAAIITGGNYPSGTVLGQLSASEKYVELDPSASDGSETAVAILGPNVVATPDDKSAVIFSRDTEWCESLMIFNDALTSEEKQTAKDQLASRGIIARTDEDS